MSWKTYVPSRSAAPKRLTRGRYGVVADDLTGATDVAAAFAAVGFKALAVLNPAKLKELHADVLVLTTNSRHEPATMAVRRVARGCSLLKEHGYPVVYKKMDSTIQGNVVAEVNAILGCGDYGCAIVCPSNPGQGRFVEKSILWVRGERLIDLRDLFHGASVTEAVHLPVALSKVRKALQTRASVILADAKTDGELDALVRAAADPKDRVLLAGSAGMAARLAHFLAKRSRASRSADSELLQFSPRERPALILCGSRNPVTRAQLRALVQAEAGAEYKLSQGRAIRTALSSGRCAVVRVPVHEEPEGRLLEQLGELDSLWKSRTVGSLLISGGDTAQLVCGWLDAHGIEVRGELLPGLAWGVVLGGKAEGVLICTKPGGFGEVNSLTTAVRALCPRSIFNG